MSHVTRHLALVASLATSLLAGCPPVGLRPTIDIRTTRGESAADIDSLSAEFYGPGPATDFPAHLAAAMAKHPASGPLHEIAGYWALLQGDDHQSWESFLRAAVDTENNNAALDIDEATRHALTRSEVVSTVAALSHIAAHHPDADARAHADYARAGYLELLGRSADARSISARLGDIPAFSLLGAFDNQDGKGFNEVYPPELKPITQGEQSTPVPGAVVPIHWRRADTVDGSLPLADLVYPNQQAVVYAAVWVNVPGSTGASLRITTDVPVVAWVNRAPVIREDRIRRSALDNVSADISLQQGQNEILVKSAAKSGPWNLAVRITDLSGNPMPNLTSAAIPGPQEQPAGRAVSAATLPRPALHRKGLSATSGGTNAGGGFNTAHADFTEARRLVLRGLYQPGLGALEKLLAAAGTNPLLRYFTADAASHDQQIERALDLLTSGIPTQKGRPALTAFLVSRARIYLHKELFNQALRDLTHATDQSPAARQARIDLVELLAHRGWHTDRAAVLEQFIARWPDAAFAHAALGAAREAQGYHKEATQAYQKAADLLPGDPDVQRVLRKLADHRDDARAVSRIFDRLAILDPTDVSDQLAHAEYARTHGHRDEAEARLVRLSAQSPDLPTPYFRRAHLAEERGQQAQAIALFQQAQERDPRDSWLAERLQHLMPETQDVLNPYIPSDDDIELAVHRPTTKGDLASHTEVLLSDEAVLLNNDGSVRLVKTEVLRPLTQRGRDELVRLSLPSDGPVRVLRAFAETPGGQRQDASSVERTQVRFRNLEVGSTVVLQYASFPRRTGALADDFFSDVSFSMGMRHVDRKRQVVVAPKNKALYLDVDSRVVHTIISTGADNSPWVVHQFVRENIAALPAEPGMVPFPDLHAHVVLTTLPSWDSFIRWEKAILDESFPADPAINALAAKLTQNETTARGKLAKLFSFVAQEIRYQQEYESILAGWQPHRSAVVLQRKYGDCKDKSTLLIALAKAVGIRVEFTVLSTHHMGHPGRKVVLPNFNHAIAYVPAQEGIEEPFFMDTTVDALDLWNLREDDQGAAGLVMDPQTGKWNWVDIPYQQPAFQAQRWKMEVNVDSAERASVRAHLELRGSQASTVRHALRSEDQSRQLYDLLASYAFPGGKVIAASAPDHESLAHPLNIEEEIDIAASIRQEGDHYRIKFPNEAESSQTKLNARQTPLDLGAPRTSASEIVLHLGPDVKLVDKPMAVDVTDPCFHLRRTVGGDRNTVVLNNAFEQTCTTVSVEDYPRYRANMERARSLLDSAVVFDKADAKSEAPPETKPETKVDKKATGKKDKKQDSKKTTGGVVGSL